MTADNTIALPDPTYNKLMHIAKQRNLDVTSLIESYIADDQGSSRVVDWSEPDTAVDQEEQAFLRLHPQLVQQYLDQYVAIQNGQLIDRDQNLGNLVKRVDAAYPDDFVWVSKVEPEPLPPLRVRSPRLINP